MLESLHFAALYFGVVVALILNTATVASATTIDLAEPWTEGSLYNRNKAYCTIQANLCTNIRGYVVVQNGEIVAEAYNPGNDANGKYKAWSVTKSWTTMLIGYMVQLGLLSTSDTLNDIFNLDSDWEGVEGAPEKKALTVEELLTMTSGLTETYPVLLFLFTGEQVPQDNFQQVMNAVTYKADKKGTWQYLSQIHILAHIILRRSGFTPREFVQNYGIFSKMGISETDYDWTTFNMVEGTAYGLITNPRVLAKLGQLYLQDGASAPGEQLISSEWVSLSTTDQLSDGEENCVPGGAPNGYGYQWYANKDGGTGSREGLAAALGAYGQIIVFLPNSNTTIAIMGNDCTLGDVINDIFLQTIIDNLEDLSVEQTSCTECYSSWKYYTKNALPLVSGSLRTLGSYFYYPV